MQRVAGRLAAASGSRPAGTFWPGTLPHPDLGRAPCCVEAGREMRAAAAGARERFACGAAAAAETRERMCVQRGGGGGRDPERMCVRRGGSCRDAERCVRRGGCVGDVRAPPRSIWIILSFFIQYDPILIDLMQWISISN